MSYPLVVLWRTSQPKNTKVRVTIRKKTSTRFLGGRVNDQWNGTKTICFALRDVDAA